MATPDPGQLAAQGAGRSDSDGGDAVLPPDEALKLVFRCLAHE